MTFRHGQWHLWHLWVKGTKNRTSYINISQLARGLGSQLCQALPGLHAYTGCDTVSAFAGCGKVSALKLLQKNENFWETFQKVGADWTLTPELYAALQEITCQMYSSKSRNTNINEMRYALFCAKKGIESCQLPPCSDSLRKHWLRANYQGAIWRRCLENNPEVPSPVEHGWSRVDQDGDLQLSIDWFNVSIAPQAVWVSVSCKRDCVTPSCQCVAKNLACTDLCHASAKTRRMTLLMRNNPIPLMRISTRSLIIVVALNYAICAKMS